MNTNLFQYIYYIQNIHSYTHKYIISSIYIQNITLLTLRGVLMRDRKAKIKRK